MGKSSARLNITLDAERAAKLSRLASRTHVQEGTLARSLLAAAIDDADPDPQAVTDVLDAIPGAWRRAELGLTQARHGDSRPIDEL